MINEAGIWQESCGRSGQADPAPHQAHTKGWGEAGLRLGCLGLPCCPLPQVPPDLLPHMGRQRDPNRNITYLYKHIFIVYLKQLRAESQPDKATNSCKHHVPKQIPFTTNSATQAQTPLAWKPSRLEVPAP